MQGQWVHSGLQIELGVILAREFKGLGREEGVIVLHFLPRESMPMHHANESGDWIRTLSNMVTNSSQ